MGFCFEVKLVFKARVDGFSVFVDFQLLK